MIILASNIPDVCLGVRNVFMAICIIAGIGLCIWGICSFFNEMMASFNLGLPSWKTPRWKFVQRNAFSNQFIGDPPEKTVREAEEKWRIWPLYRCRFYRYVYISELFEGWLWFYALMLVSAFCAALVKVVIWAVSP